MSIDTSSPASPGSQRQDMGLQGLGGRAAAAVQAHTRVELGGQGSGSRAGPHPAMTVLGGVPTWMRTCPPSGVPLHPHPSPAEGPGAGDAPSCRSIGVPAVAAVAAAALGTPTPAHAPAGCSAGAATAGVGAVAAASAACRAEAITEPRSGAPGVDTGRDARDGAGGAMGVGAGGGRGGARHEPLQPPRRARGQGGRQQAGHVPGAPASPDPAPAAT